MIIRSNNFVLKLEEILKDNLPTERYNEHENFVLKMVREWHSNRQSFTHQTSGSTGRPKKIEISRDKIKISANATMSYIDPNRLLKSSLLCLNPRHIGGAMVVYRSILFDQDLTIVDPTANPLAHLADGQLFDLVSLVPMQFKNLKAEETDRFHTILIGGGAMETIATGYKANVYATFGMTETVSHIALRRIDTEFFTTTGDTEVAAYAENLLQVRGSITSHKWLKTNDIVHIKSKFEFEWIGRNDFVINSGGIKISPELVESMLEDKVAADFIIGSLPDEKLGRKLILLISGPRQFIDFSNLEKYHRPKEVYFNQVILKTPNGKVDRIKTQLEFEKSL